MPFFDQFGRQVTNITQDTARKAKNTSEISKLNYQISNIEKQLSVYFKELGQFCYQQYKENGIQIETDILGKIATAYNEISKLEAEILQIQGVRQCPSCGAKVSLSAAFCSTCGNRLPIVEQRKCPYCNTELNENDSFCCMCGKKLPNNEAK